MRFHLFAFLILVSSAIFAQKPCYHNSRLYLFEKHDEPMLFTDPLGRRPQFPFLQRKNGITTVDAFIKSIQNPAQRAKYTRTFPAFDLLLHNSGFEHGWKDLNTKNVRKVYIPAGTIGNLGFFNQETNVINYLYVKLNPAGEAEEGIEAWKLINKNGCFLYILFTCGNAFYPNGDAVIVVGGPVAPGIKSAPGILPNGGNKTNGASCRTVTVQSSTTAVPQQSDSITRKAKLRMNFYAGHIIKSTKKGMRYDTAVELIRYKDTTVRFRDRLVVPAKMDSASRTKYFTVCRDSVIQMRVPLVGDLSKQTDSVHPITYVISDTAYDREKPMKEEPECTNNWAISIEAGNSWNSIPRLSDPVQHTQTNGGQFTGTLEVSRIMVPWFQVGIRASYIILSYQDDVNYPGYTPGVYNIVYLAKPIIPVQLFGKFNVGKEIGFQESASIAIGYSIPLNGKIVSGNTTLTTNPNLKGDFTASLKFGIAYYFNCHVGVGASFTGEYFNNKSDLIAYSLYALPVQLGLHFRF